MAMIKGITVEILEKRQTGVDPFQRPIYEETIERVENVLIGEPSTDEVIETLNLTGKKLSYILGIPKGDNHEWEGKKVKFFGETFLVIGKPMQGIEENIPLLWNKKVKVESYG